MLRVEINTSAKTYLSHVELLRNIPYEINQVKTLPKNTENSYKSTNT